MIPGPYLKRLSLLEVGLSRIVYSSLADDEQLVPELKLHLAETLEETLHALVTERVIHLWIPEERLRDDFSALLAECLDAICENHEELPYERFSIATVDLLSAQHSPLQQLKGMW